VANVRLCPLLSAIVKSMRSGFACFSPLFHPLLNVSIDTNVPSIHLPQKLAFKDFRGKSGMVAGTTADTSRRLSDDGG